MTTPTDRPPTDEPRYTLDEARALLAQRDCLRDGHDLDAVRVASGETLWVYCVRCPARFLPADGPRPEPGQMVMVHDGVAYPLGPGQFTSVEAGAS